MTSSSWNGGANPWGSGSSFSGWQGVPAQDPFAYGDQLQEGPNRSARCNSSVDCGSGFACIEGVCVLIQDENSNSGSGGCLSSGGSSGSGGSCSGTVSSSPGSCTTATAGNCQGGSVSGGGQTGCSDDSIPIGGDWSPPSNDSCSAFCDGWKDNFGGDHPGCGGKTCEECEECSIFGECGKATDDTCQCGGALPENLGRCYRCSPGGEWLITSCPDIPETEKPQKPPENECEPVCTTSDVCVTNSTTGVTTCMPVEQCGDLPASCEPCDCDCDQNCPTCQICVDGKCVPDPSCELKCDGAPCEGSCVRGTQVLGVANTYGPWSLSGPIDESCVAFPGYPPDDPICPLNCGAFRYELTTTQCDGSQNTAEILLYNCNPPPEDVDLGLTCCNV